MKKFEKKTMKIFLMFTLLSSLSLEIYAGSRTTETKKCKVQFGVFILPYLGLDSGRQIVRDKDGDYERERERDQQQGKKGGSGWTGYERYVLRESEEDAPYNVFDHEMIEGGLITGVYGAIPGFSVSIGAVPVVGKMAQAERIVDGENARLNSIWLSPIQIPTKASDLDDWKVNETVEFAHYGTIVAFLGVGGFYVSAGVHIYKSGQWKKVIKKIDENKVEVQLVNIKSEGLGAQIGISLGPKIAKKIDKDFMRGKTYHIDLSDQEGRDAFDDLLKGDYRPVQTLAENRPEVATHEKTVQASIVKKSKGFKIGHGLIYRLTKKKIRSNLDQMTVFHQDGKRSEVEVSTINTVTLIKQLRNPFRKATRYEHEEYNRGTQAASYSSFSDSDSGEMEEIDLNINNMGMHDIDVPHVLPAPKELVTMVDKGGFLKISWNYINDRTSQREASDGLGDIKNDTGMGSLLNTEFPHLRDLHTVHISFSIDMENAAISDLVARLSTNQMLLEDQASNFTQAYFEKGDRQGFCSRRLTSRSRRNCQYRVVENAKTAMREASEFLKIYEEEGANLNDEEKSQLLASFGEKIRNNPLAVQALLRIDPANIKGIFLVEGTEFDRLQKEFSFVEEEW